MVTWQEIEDGLQRDMEITEDDVRSLITRIANEGLKGEHGEQLIIALPKKQLQKIIQYAIDKTIEETANDESKDYINTVIFEEIMEQWKLEF